MVESSRSYSLKKFYYEKNLGRSLLDELENVFRLSWAHQLGVSEDLIQLLGHGIRVNIQSDYVSSIPRP